MQFAPSEARLNNKYKSLDKPGAWKPVLVDHPYKGGSWIQVDLGKVTAITGIATQGMSQGPQGTYPAGSVAIYKIRYSEDGKYFRDYYGGSIDNLMFYGNADGNTTSVVRNDFKAPMYARYIRVYVVAYLRSISLRMELYGCAGLK